MNGFALVEGGLDRRQNLLVATIHLDQGAGVEHEGHRLPTEDGAAPPELLIGERPVLGLPLLHQPAEALRRFTLPLRAVAEPVPPVRRLEGLIHKVSKHGIRRTAHTDDLDRYET